MACGGLSFDLENLNPKTGSFDSNKANCTPDELTGIAPRIIETDAERCDYATHHEGMKQKYSLTLTTADRLPVGNWLAQC